MEFLQSLSSFRAGRPCPGSHSWVTSGSDEATCPGFSPFVVGHCYNCLGNSQTSKQALKLIFFYSFLIKTTRVYWNPHKPYSLKSTQLHSLPHLKIILHCGQQWGCGGAGGCVRGPRQPQETGAPSWWWKDLSSAQNKGNYSYCVMTYFPHTTQEKCLWGILNIVFLIEKNFFLFFLFSLLFGSSAVATATAEHWSCSCPGAALLPWRKMSLLKWGHSWPLWTVTSILLISVCRLSSLIPKPTCPPLLTLAQAVLCVSASALL